MSLNLGAFGQTTYPDPELKIALADFYHGCVLSYTGYVVCTSDGWSTSNSSSLGGTSLDIAMLDDYTGVATCYDGGVRVWRTTDTGVSWSRVADIDTTMLTADEINHDSYGSPLTFEDHSTGWFARFNLWGTTDGGMTWQRAADGIHPDLGISLVDVNERGDGWAATPSGTLLRLQPLQAAEPRRPRGRH